MIEFETQDILKFEGPHFYLSNFYEAPFEIVGTTYRTVEHWFQCCKALHFVDQVRIVRAATPGEAKRIGRSVEMRPNWNTARIRKMLVGVEAKFRQNPELAYKLLSTGCVHLEEGNTWGDRFWGTVNREGENYLGKILKSIRRKLRQDLVTKMLLKTSDSEHLQIYQLLKLLNP